MRIFGRKTFLALLIVLIAVLLANHTVWLWSVFVADYFLGNPSFFRAYRNQLFLQEYHANPVTGFIKAQSIFEINSTDYSFDTFKAATDNWRVPVIIRGMFSDAPLMKWTPQSLSEFFSHQENRTFLVVKNNDFTANLSKSDMQYFSHLDSEWMPLEQVIQNITNGGKNYLHNANLFFPEDGQLYKDLDLKRMGFDRETILVQYFLGKKLPGEVRGSGSALHCAAAPNLFVQISSSKKWMLMHPKWSRYLMPNMFSFQVAASSMAAVGPESSQTHRWGKFPRWEGQVNPGDALWVPGWIWHEVYNVPSDDWSLAVATRYSNFFQIWETNPLFTWMVDLGVADKPCLPGFRFLCVALHPGAEKGPRLQSASQAGREAVVHRAKIDEKLRAGTLEKDSE